ncbi:MAG: tetratricopeptide repeat protein [Myxococcales bacterium]|nr:tetratricopeptide repeat protein [Myxococcales bacterium]
MRFSLAALLFVTAAPLPAFSDEVDELTARAIQVEARVKDLDTELKPPPEASAPEIADRRLIDAQVLYELKNYEAAAIVLLDVVQKYPTSEAYPEALYFLADSLYLKRDFLSSRRYFEKILDVGAATRRYQEALQRLIELSLYTGDYTPVDGYITRLEALPPGKQLPSVPYVKGKYFYFRQRYDDALAAFAQIQAGHTYWFHSQYFIAAAKVAQGKLVDAIGAFDTILKNETKTDSHRRIAELAHLGMGRVYYDRGQFTNANAEYSKISQKSELFPDALFEQAWVSIKAKEYKKAFRALDLLLTAKPDDPQVPEVKLLVGNLHIRESEWNEATKSFEKTRDEFDPIHKQLDEILAKQSDPKQFFQELIGKNLGKFDVASYLPPLVIKWVRANPDIGHLVNVTNDLNDLKKSLEESDEIVRRLDKAVTGPQRVNIFPELARARTKALEAGNEISEIQRKLLEHERQLIGPAAGAERGQLDQLAAQRTQLEAQLATMPRSADSYQERLKKARSQFDELDRRASEINVLLASLEAQVVAIEKFYRDTRKDQKIDPQQFQSELAQVQATRNGLRKEYELLRRDLDDAVQSVGIDDAQMQQEEALKKQLADGMAREHALGAAVRQRMTGPERQKVDQIASVLDRAHAADTLLVGFNGRIDALVDEKLKDIRVGIAEEKAHVAEYQLALGGYATDGTVIGGGITAESFKNVQERFYQIVVRADVGIIDVAWALKQNKTDEDQRLVREQKREIKLLDDEFKQVLKE